MTHKPLIKKDLVFFRLCSAGIRRFAPPWWGKLFTEFSTDWRHIGRVLLAAWFWSVVPLGAHVASAGEPGPASTAQALLQRANAGDPWAQLNLGAAFDHGTGAFPLDPVRAVRWYRQAAEAGLAEAQFNLAHCLANGNGVARDDVASLRWMLAAAGQGLASAQFLAGVMLNEGMGTAPDPAAAQVWLERAADNGNTDAAALLERLRAGPAGRSGEAVSR